MNHQSILIITFGHFEKELLDRLIKDVHIEFGYSVHTRDGHLDLSDYYEPTRRQYNGNKLLKDIDAAFSFGYTKTIGIFSVDLFIPILTYIFGQAFLNGKSGIISTYRLYNERYGMEMDREIFYNRISKEVIHELGHTFGLIHCHTPTCVMRSSTYVEDLDQKDNRFCVTCKEQFESTKLE